LNIYERVVDKYNGPKISIMAAGAGMSLAQLQMIPGSSKLLHGMLFPYSEDMLLQVLGGDKRNYMVGPKGFKAVSPEVAEMMAIRARMLTRDREAVGIGITGALTTSRYRRGDNGAYIAICGRINGEVKTLVGYLEVPKSEESVYNSMTPEQIRNLRKTEDEFVASAVLDFLITKSSAGIKVITDGNARLPEPRILLSPAIS
jgi:nicotinamide mononucleotide (NMN) deamidase PncC